MDARVTTGERLERAGEVTVWSCAAMLALKFARSQALRATARKPVTEESAK